MSTKWNESKQIDGGSQTLKRTKSCVLHVFLYVFGCWMLYPLKLMRANQKKKRKYVCLWNVFYWCVPVRWVNQNNALPFRTDTHANNTYTHAAYIPFCWVSFFHINNCIFNAKNRFFSLFFIWMFRQQSCRRRWWWWCLTLPICCAFHSAAFKVQPYFHFPMCFQG